MIESWKPIKDMPYDVSDFGNIRRSDSGVNTYMHRIKAKTISSNGYVVIGAYKNGRRTDILVHRAVVESFIEAIPKNMEVNHKDGNKLNNTISNLEIVTKSENAIHAINNGLWDLTALHNSKRHCGNEHWTHKKPECLARGDNNGSRKHPESIWKGEQCKSSKLTQSDVKDIRYQYFGGMSINILANIYKVSTRNIWYIVNNKSWRSISWT